MSLNKAINIHIIVRSAAVCTLAIRFPSGPSLVKIKEINQKWLPYQILSDKNVKNGQIDLQTIQIWPKK